MTNELEPFLTTDVRNAIIEHMLTDRENEVCGVITFASGVYKYVPKDNVHENTKEFFRFDNTTSQAINTHKSVVAYVHSHPKGPEIPSKNDMDIQKAVQKPSVIACIDEGTGVVDLFSFGDHLLDYPLEDRVFRYGVFDCLEAIRSWRWQKEGVRMAQFPRYDGWWNHDDRIALDIPADDWEMYDRHYASEGYVKYVPNLGNPSSSAHPQVGDLIFMRQGGVGVINHAAIYVGNNLMFHHRFGRKSGITPVGYAVDQHIIAGWARNKDKEIQP